MVGENLARSFSLEAAGGQIVISTSAVDSRQGCTALKIHFYNTHVVYFHVCTLHVIQAADPLFKNMLSASLWSAKQTVPLPF